MNIFSQNPINQEEANFIENYFGSRKDIDLPTRRANIERTDHKDVSLHLAAQVELAEHLGFRVEASLTPNEAGSLAQSYWTRHLEILDWTPRRFMSLEMRTIFGPMRDLQRCEKLLAVAPFVAEQIAQGEDCALSICSSLEEAIVEEEASKAVRHHFGSMIVGCAIHERDIAGTTIALRLVWDDVLKRAENLRLRFPAHPGLEPARIELSN